MFLVGETNQKQEANQKQNQNQGLIMKEKTIYSLKKRLSYLDKGVASLDVDIMQAYGSILALLSIPIFLRKDKEILFHTKK